MKKPCNTQKTSLKIGQYFEQLAENYLKKNGLLLIDKNFRTIFGEIDRIMQHNHTLVFVEVRYRSHPHFGSGFESITPEKQHRLIQTAESYLLQHQKHHMPCRFDVISIQANQQIDWIKNAFTVQY